MTIPRRIILASKNTHKLDELRHLLQEGPWQLEMMQATIILPEETGATFRANAECKAEAVMRATGAWALADDSGLVVDALHGAPGIYSARYAGEPTDDRLNNERLLAELRAVAADRRTARYVCVLALARPDQPTCLVEGVCEGRIAAGPRGEGGFGYDPLFELPACGKTMAELSPEEKALLSHRAMAARQMREILLQLVVG